MENRGNELENRLAELIKQKEDGDRRLLMLEWVIGGLSVLVLLIPALLGAFLPVEQEWHRVLIVFSGLIPCLVGVFFAVQIEQKAGYYACRRCGHRYVPAFKAVFLAAHMGRTRYMRCPACGEKSWQKKVISKEA